MNLSTNKLVDKQIKPCTNPVVFLPVNHLKMCLCMLTTIWWKLLNKMFPSTPFFSLALKLTHLTYIQLNYPPFFVLKMLLVVISSQFWDNLKITTHSFLHVSQERSTLCMMILCIHSNFSSLIFPRRWFVQNHPPWNATCQILYSIKHLNPNFQRTH